MWFTVVCLVITFVFIGLTIRDLRRSERVYEDIRLRLSKMEAEDWMNRP